MSSTMFLTSLALLAAVPASAQEVVQALPGTTDADKLAADMRRLASNPRDVDALVDAAELSLKLGDPNAAAAFLARAESESPRNPRVKAGQGSILVQAERPGQALRYFAQAEGFGLNPNAFAADRGLAYDLTGEQERAQRDYRAALRSRPADDEITRRYALSLGISGQRERALRLLDPLVRRGDRGAWRAQAFVLAMTGDVAGASRIAARMMPGGAAGLAAFFQRLPTLPARDRAFAVHFGEVRVTPERLADARLAPPLSPLLREAGAPVLLARAESPPPVRREAPRAQIAAAQLARTTQVTRTPQPARTPTPVPRAVTLASAPPRAAAASAASPTAAPPQRPATPVATVASVTQRPVTTSSTLTALAAATPPPRAAPPIQAGFGSTTLSSNPVTASTSSGVAPLAQPSSAILAATAPVASSLQPRDPIATAAITGAAPAASTPPVQTASLVASSAEPRSTSSVGTASSSPPPTAPAQVASVAPASVQAVAPRTTARVGEDSILARIVASLSIPAAELGVEGPDRPAPAPAPVAAAPAPAQPDPAIAAKAEADRVAAEKLAAAKAVADKRAAERKAIADRKALAERKAAAEKKALADKAAAEEKRLARANPERIWVQVAGGASEGDLPKAYAAVRTKAPAVFGARQGWTTPLRATNRVLAGPFKTDAEARQFVNDLKKEGVGAFTFTSDPGQPVKKLAGR